jgi:alkylation response protein AidB-like acyl-CoA dehydrogenase
MGLTVIDSNHLQNVEMVRKAARDFAEYELRPVVMKYDRLQEFPHELIPKLGALGFMGALAPKEYCGAGFSYLEFIAVIEELGKVDPSIGLCVSAHNGLGVGHILTFGTAEQKKKYLPPLCSGKALGAWCLTEPDAGSDSGSMKTSAVRDGDTWVLNGEKTFITHGSVASTYTVLAVTGAKDGRNRISAFIVEKGTPGLTVSKVFEKLGVRASDTAGLRFDDLRIPAANIIGQEGEGMRQAMKLLEGGRLGIAALGVGLAQGALDASLQYVKTRKQFGKPLAEFQSIQWKLAEMATEIEAARLLTQRAAVMKMNGENVNCAVAQAKYFASDVAQRAANEAVQMHGGNGFIKDFPVEKFYRDSKLLSIGEGTTEIQKMIIAKSLLA